MLNKSTPEMWARPSSQDTLTWPQGWPDQRESTEAAALEIKQLLVGGGVLILVLSKAVLVDGPDIVLVQVAIDPSSNLE